MYPPIHTTPRDKPAIIMAADGSVLTYGELDDRANQIAHLFRDQGLRRLDHVAILMENGHALLQVCSAGERTGVYYTCINTHLSVDELAYIVNDSQAQIVVVSARFEQMATLLSALCPQVKRWLVSASVAPMAPLEDLDVLVASYPTTPIDDEQLGAAMAYTSGTTGRPKGILRPLPDGAPGDQLEFLGFMARVFQLHREMIYLSPAPLYHSAPLGAISGAIRLGATAVVMERFDEREFLGLVERYQVTTTQVVPTMFTRLLQLPDDLRCRANLSSLEAVVHAAAPCPIAVKERMIDWLGPIIYEYYGSTEGNGITFCDSSEWHTHKGTVGRPVLGDVVIVDDDGRECPRGVAGAIWFHGATRFEYFNDQERTRKDRTNDGSGSSVGDIGYLDDDGYLYLTDRRDFMIISGGVNIYPQESENVLVAHPKVYDAAVIGVPNSEYGEEVKGIVQPVEGIEPSAALANELIEYCRSQVAHYKCPRSIDFTLELPATPDREVDEADAAKSVLARARLADRVTSRPAAKQGLADHPPTTSNLHEREEQEMASNQAKELDRKLRELVGRGRPDADLAEMRAGYGDFERLTGLPGGITWTNVDCAGVPAIWASPEGGDDDRVVQYVHGGGYVLGAASYYRKLTGHLAVAVGCRVLNVDYRLAPEFPHPAAVDDSTAAYRWLLDAGIAPEHVAIVGDSAGGGLALATLLNIRGQGLPMPAAAVAMSPWADMTVSGASMLTNAETDILVGAQSLASLAALFLQGHDPSDPLASPLHGDLLGLCPIYLQAGGAETLLDDSVRLAEHARAAGVPCEVDVFPEMQHVFQIAVGNVPESDDAIFRAGQFLRGHLGLN